MKKLIALIVFCMSAPALAGDLYLDVNGYSWHSVDTYVYKNKKHEYNSKNTGLGLTYGLNKYVEVFAGFYDNSYHQDTLYGGAKIKYDFKFKNFTVTPGLNIGAATGYYDTPAQADYYQLLIMPTLRATYRGVGLTVGYLPRVEKDDAIAISVVTVQINIKLR